MAPLTIALRVDVCFDLVCDFLDHKGYGGFAVRETVNGENEHWHFLVEADVRNVQAFRVALCRAVPGLKGNGAYSATPVLDLAKYERYLCKGNSDSEGPDLAWSQSMLYTEEKLEELHGSYWEENRMIKNKRKGSMIDWAIDECKRTGVEWSERRRIASLYIKELSLRSKPINLFSIKSAVNTVSVALCPDDTAINQLAEYVWEN